MTDVNYIVEKTRRGAKSRQDVIDNIDRLDEPASVKRLAFAMNAKRVLLGIIDRAIELAEKYHEYLPADYNESIISMGREGLSMIDDDGIASLICEYTREYWPMIREHNIDYFIRHREKLIGRIEKRLEDSGTAPPFNIMELLGPVISSVEGDEVDTQDKDDIFATLESLIAYCEKYAEYAQG